MAKPVFKPNQDFNDYPRWCHIIMCGLEVKFEDCCKCSSKRKASSNG